MTFTSASSEQRQRQRKLPCNVHGHKILQIFSRVLSTYRIDDYCREGWVGWKWNCHPVSQLGQECVTSVQCQQVRNIMDTFELQMFESLVSAGGEHSGYSAWRRTL